MKRLLLMTIAVLLLAAPAVVAVATIDFESYTDGTLGTQNGWAPSHAGSWNVVSGLDSPMSGSKSLNVISEDDNYGPVLTGATIADGTVASIMLRQSPGGYLFFNLLNADGNAYCGAYFDGSSNINYAVNGFNWADTLHNYATSNNYRVNVTLNFTTQKYTLNVQDLVNSANSFTMPNLAFGSPTTAASAAVGRFYIGGVSAYFDDLYPASDPPAPPTSWFDDFNAGPANTNVSTPWENVTGCAMYAGVGYGGTIGVQGQAGNSQDWLAHMFRPRLGSGDAYVVWKIDLRDQVNKGLSFIGLKPDKPASSYGIGWTGTLVYMIGGTIGMCTYASDGSGEIDSRLAGPTLADGWWEFKMEAVGQWVSLYYRQPGTATWNLVGTRTQDFGFAPSYVGIALSCSSFIDDVGFNQEVPTGTLKGHVTLQGYTPVNTTPVAVKIQLNKDGSPFSTQDVILDANGDYLIEAVPVGTYAVTYKVKGFLRTSYSPVTITAGSDTTQSVSLINGDNNGDNEVNSTDLSITLSNRGL